MVLFNGVRTGFQWEQVKRGDLARTGKKKGNKKGVIAGLIGGILGVLMIVVVMNGMKESYDKIYGQDETPVSEQQWYTGTYAGDMSLSTPKAMKSVGQTFARGGTVGREGNGGFYVLG